MHKFYLKSQKGRDLQAVPGIEIRIILKWILKKKTGCVDWIHLTHDRVQ
jgi:hypothetical protein